MQLVNSVYMDRQSFGVIQSNGNINTAIQRRLFSSADAKRLEAIVNDQYNNNIVGISLFLQKNGKFLDANVYEYLPDPGKTGLLLSRSEGFLTRMRGGNVVDFIENLAKLANREANRIRKANPDIEAKLNYT